jgi:hypothetical protein
MLVLPRFAVGMLLARKLVAADNPNDAIFASRHGTWLSPNNVRRQWRQARADADLEWVTAAHLPQDRCHPDRMRRGNLHPYVTECAITCFSDGSSQGREMASVAE